MKKNNILILAIILMALFSSCKTKEVIRYVDVPSVSIKTDSIYLSKIDSIVLYQKGDTVFREKYRTIFKDRFKYEIDSISIPVEVRVEVPVEKIVEKSVYIRDVFW